MAEAFSLVLGSRVDQATERLRASGSESPRLDAEVLAAHALGIERTGVLAHPETRLSPAEGSLLDACIARRAAGEPVAYIRGLKEFHGLAFAVDRRVLIPRPETELLVEEALSWLKTRPAPVRAADVGAGSGCIAVTLAVHAPHLTLFASDRSAAALRVARQNALKHGVEKRIHFAQADLLAPFSGPFDLVCANLPYIPTHTLAGLAVAAHEPHLALDGGPGGLDLIRRLLESAPRWLAGDGLLLLEIEERQAAPVLALARICLPGAAASVKQDLQGKDRLIIIRRL
jgi:release factor glutamine methyltransferase